MTRQIVAFDHNRLLKAVAAEMLEPLGLYQVGRSRMWVDDRSWWVIVVSFGPSGYGRGSYLNVGVSLLWRPIPIAGFAFDADLKNRWKTPMGRFESQFIEARRPEWFERDVRAFCNGAIDHINMIRARPNNLRALVARLEQVDDLWGRYHRGVARGLLRDGDAASRDFASVLGEPNSEGADRLSDMKDSARALRELLATPTAFDSQIASQVVRCRREARLGVLTDDAVLASLSADV